jgi:hypothetical protein
MEQTASSNPPLEATMIDSTLAACVMPLNHYETEDIVRRFIDEALNEGNVDVAAQFVWDDVVRTGFRSPPVMQKI